MYYHTFKGKEISALGMGGLRYPTVCGQPNTIDRGAGQAIVDLAFKNGINYFDTAYTYQNGDSEVFLGEALSRYPRESYFLATKYYEKTGMDIESVFQRQLERMKTDYFDFYLLHCLDATTVKAYTDPQKDYIGFLLKQKAAGKIKNIGFSSHASPDILSRFLDYFDGFDMALIQLNYVDWTLLDAEGQYEVLSDHKIPVWVMEPMKGGRLSELSPKSAPVLMGAAPENTLSSWGFRFLMTLPNVCTVLSGMSSESQLEDNCKTFSTFNPLSEAETRTLMKAKELFISELGVPCSGCRYCCDTCPAHIDIPRVIRSYNELKLSCDRWRIHTSYFIPENTHCLGCGTCLTRCPQKINIPDIMKEFGIQ